MFTKAADPFDPPIITSSGPNYRANAVDKLYLRATRGPDGKRGLWFRAFVFEPETRDQSPYSHWFHENFIYCPGILNYANAEMRDGCRDCPLLEKNSVSRRLTVPGESVAHGKGIGLDGRT